MFLKYNQSCLKHNDGDTEVMQSWCSLFIGYVQLFTFSVFFSQKFCSFMKIIMIGLNAYYLQ